MRLSCIDGAWYYVICLLAHIPVLRADESALLLPCAKKTEGCVVLNGKKSCPMDVYRKAGMTLLHYLRPAKTASTALTNAISCSQMHTPAACAPVEVHTNHLYTADQLPLGALSFTVLRNPCERFGSAFRFIRQTICLTELRHKLEEIDRKRFKRPAEWRRIKTRDIKAAFPSDFQRCNSGGGSDVGGDGKSDSASFGSPMELLRWFAIAQAKVCNGSAVCSGTVFSRSPEGGADLPPWPPSRLAESIAEGEKSNRTQHWHYRRQLQAERPHPTLVQRKQQQLRQQQHDARSIAASSFRALSLLQPQAAYATTAPMHYFACLGAGRDHAHDVQEIFDKHVPGCNLMAMAVERSSSSSSSSLPWSQAHEEGGALCAAVRRVYADDARLWAEHCAASGRRRGGWSLMRR